MAKPQGYINMVKVFAYSDVSLCTVIPGRETGKEQDDGHSPNFSALVKGIANQVTGLGPSVLEMMVLSTPTFVLGLYFCGWHPDFLP